MGKGNPFVRGGAIRHPALFFERSTVTRSAVDLLRNRQCVSVVGPPRIGKSSLLRYLERRLEHGAEHSEEAGAERYCCVFVDCKALGSEEPDQCAQTIHSELALHLDELGLADVLPQKPASPGHFLNLQMALRSVRRQGLRVVLLFDNFDTLGENPLLDKGFFDWLSSVNAKEYVLYVTASSRPLGEITYSKAESKTSEFFRLFTPIPLSLLPEVEAARLLTELARHGGVEFPGELVSRLVELAGPHPLLLQIAGYHAFEHLAEAKDAAPDLVASCMDAVHVLFLDEAEGVWMDLWKHAIPENETRYYLALLALKQKANDQVVSRLRRACVVREQNGRLVSLSGAFRRFVAQQEISPLIQAWPVVLDPQERIALLRDQVLTLTVLEFRLLECLAGRADHVVTYRDIIDYVWSHYAVRDYTNREPLKTLKGDLAKKLKDKDDHELVKAEPDVGYRFTSETH